MHTVLLTAFEPFAGADLNPSACVAAVIARAPLDGLRVVTAILPVVAAEVPGRVASLIDAHQPDAILSLGEARGARHIRVEQRAVNRLAFQTDNSGAPALDGPVIEGGAIETLVPGHGAIAQGHAQVRARLHADLDYLDRLEAGVRDARRAGLSLEDTRAKLSTMTITGRDDPEYPMGPIHEQNVTHAYRSSTTAVAAPRSRR